MSPAVTRGPSRVSSGHQRSQSCVQRSPEEPVVFPAASRRESCSVPSPPSASKVIPVRCVRPVLNRFGRQPQPKPAVQRLRSVTISSVVYNLNVGG